MRAVAHPHRRHSGGASLLNQLPIGPIVRAWCLVIGEQLSPAPVTVVSESVPDDTVDTCTQCTYHQPWQLAGLRLEISGARIGTQPGGVFGTHDRRLVQEERLLDLISGEERVQEHRLPFRNPTVGCPPAL